MILPVRLLLHEGDNEVRRGAQQRIDAAQKILVERVQVLPPQALHGPRRFAHFVTPRRRRISHHLAGHGISRVREKRSRHFHLLPRIPLRDGQQLFDEIHVRQVLVHVIAGKNAPENLLSVVVHVVVAVPGGADLAAGPVSEQTRRQLARAQAASQEVLVVVPEPLQFLVVKLHRRA